MTKKRKKKKRSKKKSINTRTGISGHRRSGSNFKPPFLQIPNISPSSWKDDRMPEMLWAVLVTGRMERSDALAYFRYVLRYVQENDILDLTMSAIDRLEEEAKRSLIQHMCDYSEGIRTILKPLLLFDNLPSRAVWSQYLSQASPEEDWNELAICIARVIDHHSQEATDCRWVKLMPQVLTGKIQMPRGHVEDLLAYPNRGDMCSVRPFVRAAEIAFPSQNKVWPENFWKQGHSDTSCFPLNEDVVPKETFELSSQQLDFIRRYLVKYFIETDEVTSIDPKHDAVFGILLFSMTLLEEQVATNLSRGSLARIVLRNITEAYIVLAYLLEKDDTALWAKFRDYGVGQIKLVSLKYDEMKEPPRYLNGEKMKQFANEDRWEEFTPIEVGNWDKKNLRKMSEEAKCKDVYDRYYVWTSSYSHSGWGAIRESVMTLCGNPLHRLHLIPREHSHPMKSTLQDVVYLVNLQLDMFQKVYSDFGLRITDEVKLERFALIFTLKAIIQKKEGRGS